MMTIPETIAFIRLYNRWRRSEDERLPMPEPKLIGKALEALTDALEEAVKDTERLNFFEANSHEFRHFSRPTMDSSLPCWSCYNRREGRIQRKTLREAIDTSMEP